MNKKNLLKIADFIERENNLREAGKNALRLDMNDWIGSEHMYYTQEYEEHLDQKISEAAKEDFCGTSACIGGTANLLQYMERVAKRKAKDDTIKNVCDNMKAEDAQEWLGLNKIERDDLFFCRQLDEQLAEIAIDAGEDYEYGEDGGYDYINHRRRLVPQALRWMVDNHKIDWLEALDAAEAAEKCGIAKRAEAEAKKTPVHSD